MDLLRAQAVALTLWRMLWGSFAWLVFQRFALLVPVLAVGLGLEATRRRAAPASVPVNLGLVALGTCADIGARLLVLSTVMTAALELPGAGFAAVPITGPWTFAAAALLWVLAHDLGYYWLHRAQHAWPWLWALHAVHHSDEHVNVTTSFRFHPLDPIVQTLVLALPITYAFGGQQLGATAYVVTVVVPHLIHLDLPLHAGPLNRVLSTPASHRLHHSAEARHRDRNFGAVLTLWDVAFGTYVEPTREPFRTGLGTGERVATVREAVEYPFHAWGVLWRSVTGRA